MKTRNLLAVTLAATLALTGCNKGDEPGGEPTRDQVTITTSIGGNANNGTGEGDALGSRATIGADGSGSFEASDVLGLYATTGGATKLDNKEYTASTKLYWNDLSTTAPVTFAAYYPRTATIADPAAYVFNAATAEDKDLLVATPVTKKKGEEVKLNFRHAMHRLLVNMTTDVDGLDLTLAIVRLTGMNAAATVNITTGTVTAGEANEPDGTYEPVSRRQTPNTTAGVTAEFVVAPQKVTTGADWIVITAEGGKQYTYKMPAQIKNAVGTAIDLKELESGKTLTLNLVITKGGVKITTGDIAPWNDQGKIDGEIDYGSGVIVASTIAQLKAAIDAATGTAANPTVIRLGADIDIPTAGGEFGNAPTFSLGDLFDNTAPARHIKIDGAGHSLIAKENGSRMLFVGNGSSLTLTNLTLDGNNTATAYSIVTAASASTITLDDGTILQNLNNENWGDGTVFPSVGVSLVGASTLVMNSGASIKDVEGHAIRSEDNSQNQIRLNRGSISGSQTDIFVNVAMPTAIIRIAALPTVDGDGKMEVISGYYTLGGTSPLIAPESGSTALSLDDFTFTILDSNNKADITAQCDIFLGTDGIIKIRKKP